MRGVRPSVRPRASRRRSVGSTGTPGKLWEMSSAVSRARSIELQWIALTARPSVSAARRRPVSSACLRPRSVRPWEESGKPSDGLRYWPWRTRKRVREPAAGFCGAKGGRREEEVEGWADRRHEVQAGAGDAARAAEARNGPARPRVERAARAAERGEGADPSACDGRRPSAASSALAPSQTRRSAGSTSHLD